MNGSRSDKDPASAGGRGLVVGGVVLTILVVLAIFVVIGLLK